ncbi:MAG: right-handed parallel beta-helix repeat-containing protein [Candidatus Schekmanbacteria bacterium]|nr:right-handed parallel beta-helix repeat-containing protein [Candidatus Schekmanbacteria bacterium]
MKIQKSIVGLVLALAAPFILIWPQTPQAATWFPTGVEIVSVHEGESIQAAINKIKEGGMVLVSSGVYYETIKLKPKVVLRSESGPEQTTIDGSHGQGTVVQLAEGSTLDGFTVTGRVETDQEQDRHAIECVDISPTIKNNVIRDNKGTGLYISGAQTEPQVSGNRIYDNQKAGIGITNQSKAQIFENQCYGNAEAGIGIRGKSAPTVKNNKCFLNQKVGIGISDKGTSPLVEGNECYDNEGAGIGLQEGATAVLKNNNVHKNGRAGIGLRDASSATIEGNQIEANILAGIGIIDKSVATIKDNQIINNTMAGVTAMDGCKVTIENNLIEANGTQGIVCSSSEVLVKKNRVLKNIHHGIGIYRQSKAEVCENQINYNGANDKRGSGILVVSSDESHIHHNDFNDNYGPGVYTRRCSPLISENTFTNDLIFAMFHASPTIKNNVFYSAGKSGGKKAKSGVDIRESSHPIITENEFLGKFAIAVHSKSHPLVMKNKFSGSHKNSIDSGRSGIKVNRNCRPSIVDNIFYNGNKLLIVGRSVTENAILSFGNTGQIKTMNTTNIDFKPEEHGGKNLIVAGNQFLGPGKGREKKKK